MPQVKRQSILCFYCRARMRGRRGERLERLRERAKRTGWKDLLVYDGNLREWRSACQVCAPKVGA